MASVKCPPSASCRVPPRGIRAIPARTVREFIGNADRATVGKKKKPKRKKGGGEWVRGDSSGGQTVDHRRMPRKKEKEE